MRRLLRFFVLTLALLGLGAGVSVGSAFGAWDSAFVIYKELPSGGVTEVRDSNGALLARYGGQGGRHAPDCRDRGYLLSDARWYVTPSYLVNVDSLEAAGLGPNKALREIRDAHEAWSHPFTTDCRFRRFSPYESQFVGDTPLGASTALLELDGVNVVELRPLADTVCDGALACVVTWSEDGRIEEADLAIESDVAKFGDYRWTTGDRTRFDGDGGKFALIDIATHEWGHFAGLDHVADSPDLTMYPLLHDGMQTLGRGDMKGILALYGPGR